MKVVFPLFVLFFIVFGSENYINLGEGFVENKQDQTLQCANFSVPFLFNKDYETRKMFKLVCEKTRRSPRGLVVAAGMIGAGIASGMLPSAIAGIGLWLLRGRQAVAEEEKKDLRDICF
uniref:Uncharacterized protein n=1 Tax=Caenorhabditis japonica TaxID=281687 RepID=A0A8R1EAW0_CAEJA